MPDCISHYGFYASFIKQICIPRGGVCTLGFGRARLALPVSCAAGTAARIACWPPVSRVSSPIRTTTRHGLTTKKGLRHSAAAEAPSAGGPQVAAALKQQPLVPPGPEAAPPPWMWGRWSFAAVVPAGAAPECKAAAIVAAPQALMRWTARVP